MHNHCPLCDSFGAFRPLTYYTSLFHKSIIHLVHIFHSYTVYLVVYQLRKSGLVLTSKVARMLSDSSSTAKPDRETTSEQGPYANKDRSKSLQENLLCIYPPVNKNKRPPVFFLRTTFPL